MIGFSTVLILCWIIAATGALVCVYIASVWDSENFQYDERLILAAVIFWPWFYVCVFTAFIEMVKERGQRK